MNKSNRELIVNLDEMTDDEAMAAALKDMGGFLNEDNCILCD